MMKIGSRFSFSGIRGILPYVGSAFLHTLGIGAVVLSLQEERAETAIQTQTSQEIQVHFLQAALREQGEAIVKDTGKVRAEAASKAFIPKSNRAHHSKRQSSTEKKTTVSSPKSSKGGISLESCAEEKGIPLDAPKPSYPLIARRKKWEGRVLVRVHVTSMGEVFEASLVSSSSYPCLDKAALKGLLSWRFPALRGTCKERIYTVPVTFSLKS